jgi:DNA-binding IscR family transcriptional regulator
MMDGPIAPLPCLSRRAYHACEDCEDEETCRIRRVFGDLFSAYLLMVESLTLADLMKDDSPLTSEPAVNDAV